MKKRELVYIVLIALLVLSCVILSILLFTEIENKKNTSYYDKKCEAFALENANFSQGQIVFIGDSITDGYILANYYADLPIAVYNRGIGGDTTGGVLRRLKTSVLDISPSKIVIMIGINDINGGINTEEIIENYNKILSKIKEELPNTKVYCMSILPLNKDLENYTTINVDKSLEIIKKTNIAIEELAICYEYEFVNIFNSFADDNGYLCKELSIDGIHLTPEGYSKWTAGVKPLLNDTN